MLYAMQILPHPNIRYQDSQVLLSRAELSLMLQKCGFSCETGQENHCGSTFLTFSVPEMTDEMRALLYFHSSAGLLCRKDGESLVPEKYICPDYLPRDLPEILKYKGKTNTGFTKMMINMAACASSFNIDILNRKNFTVLDPICGKGTTLFCAAAMGMNSVGIDTDRSDLAEAIGFFSKYLEFHRLKHQMKQTSLTAGKASVPKASFTFADTKEHFSSDDFRSMDFLQCDTGMCGEVMRKKKADFLVADLPYGIQHAPQNGKKPESFREMLCRVLPGWYNALAPGGAAAISFNTKTLKRKDISALLADSGFSILENIGSLEHFVEQAVTRDLIIALK